MYFNCGLLIRKEHASSGFLPTSGVPTKLIFGIISYFNPIRWFMLTKNGQWLFEGTVPSIFFGLHSNATDWTLVPSPCHTLVGLLHTHLLIIDGSLGSFDCLLMVLKSRTVILKCGRFFRHPYRTLMIILGVMAIYGHFGHYHHFCLSDYHSPI